MEKRNYFFRLSSDKLEFLPTLSSYLMSLSTDRIAVFMGNTIAYPIIWLACMSLNITPGFINNSLTGPGLVHCISVSEARLVIYEPGLEGPLSDVVSDLTSKTLVREFICYDDGITAYGPEKPSDGSFKPSLPSSVYFGPKDLLNQSTKPISLEWRAKVEESTPAALIFTSGTTGELFERIFLDSDYLEGFKLLATLDTITMLLLEMFPIELVKLFPLPKNLTSTPIFSFTSFFRSSQGCLLLSRKNGNWSLCLAIVEQFHFEG